MEPDTPRYLHRHPAYGYTPDPGHAAQGEPEALTADQYRTMIDASRARRRESEMAELDVAAGELRRRLTWLASQRRHRDVRSTVRAIERQLARLDKLIAR